MHLTENDLVLHHYHDSESPAAVEQHLASCPECRNELESIRRVLALVDELPVPDRGDGYGEQVWNRLRWRLGGERRRNWQSMLAAAAVLAVAFIAGVLWHARNVAPAPSRLTPKAAQVAPAGATAPRSHDRVLVVVVTDHLDSSERMLQELENADPKRPLDLGDERKRAEDLLTSNQIYRQTAAQRGDERLAAVLSDLEPVLIEIANSDAKLTPEEVSSLQRRIDSKGLLFKVRVASAQTKGVNSL